MREAKFEIQFASFSSLRYNVPLKLFRRYLILCMAIFNDFILKLRLVLLSHLPCPNPKIFEQTGARGRKPLNDLDILAVTKT